jgi:hypothetical protein
MSAEKRRRQANMRRANVKRLVQCDGTCHDRDEECRKCEQLVDAGHITGCDDCLFYAAQDAEVQS